jgi:protein kinase C substrate 80K-H
MVGSCAVVQEGEEIEFPSEIPDGYYNYYEPQTRSSDDGINRYFSRVNSLHMVPENLMNLRKQKLEADKKKNSLAKEVADLERDTAPKYGVDGELYSMRDTCHTVESGKYEYEVCIFGKATQRDIGQKSGGTNLGSWKEMVVEDGRQTLKWDGGLKCWNGPVRSAEVSVTCGAETKLLTADEPETCKYAFTMESPLACVNPP